MVMIFIIGQESIEDITDVVFVYAGDFSIDQTNEFYIMKESGLDFNQKTKKTLFLLMLIVGGIVSLANSE